jgi:hypothetical protein
MPYHIRKQPNQPLYKVYTQDGRPLSKKGLPLEKAKKQMRAVEMNEFSKKKNK